MNLKITFLIAFVSLFTNAYSQINQFAHGIYQVSDGSLHEGELRYNRLKGDQLEVKTSSRKPHYLQPDTVIGFRIGADTFMVVKDLDLPDGLVSDQNSSPSYFLHLIKTGKVELYKLYSVGYSHAPIPGGMGTMASSHVITKYLVKKGQTGKLISVPEFNAKKFKAAMLPVFGDNEYFKNGIERGGFTDSQIERIVEFYNKDFGIQVDSK